MSDVMDERSMNKEQIISLSQVPIGGRCVIVSIDPAMRGLKKFADIGLIVGATVTLVGRAPIGGLIRVEIMDSNIAIHTNDAKYIMVQMCQAKQEEVFKPTVRYKIALAGNPNCGKTSIFNQLTGTRQHVGNYPGVTVESKAGFFELDGIPIELIDLPGVYSLSSSTPEETVVFQEFMKKGIDLIINVVDSTIPQRSLYLTTQLAELHIPMLLAFNMADDARKLGLKFDIKKLETYFGSPIVPTVGSNFEGCRDLLEQLKATLPQLENHGVPMLTYGSDLDDSIKVIADEIDALQVAEYAHIPARFFAIKLLEHDTCAMRIEEFKKVQPTVEQEIQHLLKQHTIETDTFMADKRYAMLSGACRDAITTTRTNEKRREISDKIDTVLANGILGLPIFLGIIYITFWLTFSCAAPLMSLIENFFGFLGMVIEKVWNPEVLPFLRSLLIDGVLAGVGGVLSFLPNILLLFFAIAILEDSGYMSRAAFVMDGIMRKFGLQGRSFVPLILGFGCSVPAIMATRCIESTRDRTTTIMVLPMMSCGARLPIYSLIIPAFFVGRTQPFMMFVIYLIGVLFSLVSAFVLKRTLFKGEGEVYLMELPPYRLPSAKSLMLHMWDRSKAYLHKASTIILFASIVLYLANTYPQKKVFSQNYQQQIEQLQQQVEQLQQQEAKEAVTQQIEELENQQMAEQMEYTIAGRIGKFLEPVVKPIGFDWKLATASVSALAAKEVFVSQLGILYAVGDDSVENGRKNEVLREKLQENYTPLQGICIMLFSLLSIPCAATLAVIRRELNSWKMPVIEACGLLIIAYITTFLVYQIGRLITL